MQHCKSVMLSLGSTMQREFRSKPISHLHGVCWLRLAVVAESFFFGLGAAFVVVFCRLLGAVRLFLFILRLIFWCLVLARGLIAFEAPLIFFGLFSLATPDR